MGTKSNILTLLGIGDNVYNLPKDVGTTNALHAVNDVCKYLLQHLLTI